MSKNYIFGYGSLIERASRLRTTPHAKKALPVKAKGFKRGWFARTGVAGLTTTFLGCIPDKESYTNGVIYEVTEEELKKTNERETGYTPVKIELDDITTYSEKKIKKNSNIWIYTNQFDDDQIPKDQLPNKEFPIVQSYVDICINGCLEIDKKYLEEEGNKFTRDFIRSTAYWNEYWVNDRIYPRRPFIYRPNAYTIDRLLQDHLADKSLFDKIYFE